MRLKKRVLKAPRILSFVPYLEFDHLGSTPHNDIVGAMR
jgi:hypothetical protein